MFSRFRNLFSKNKTETDADGNEDAYNGRVSDSYDVGESASATASSPDCSKLEGLNLLKSLVENEQNLAKTEAKGASSETALNANQTSSSLSQEVEELLRDKLSNSDIKSANESLPISLNGHSEQESKPLTNSEKIIENKTLSEIFESAKENSNSPLESQNQPETPIDKIESVHDLLHKMKTEVMTLSYVTKETSPLLETIEQNQDKPSVNTPEQISENKQKEILDKISEKEDERKPDKTSDPEKEDISKLSLEESASEQSQEKISENTKNDILDTICENEGETKPEPTIVGKQTEEINCEQILKETSSEQSQEKISKLKQKEILDKICEKEDETKPEPTIVGKQTEDIICDQNLEESSSEHSQEKISELKQKEILDKISEKEDETKPQQTTVGKQSEDINYEQILVESSSEPSQEIIPEHKPNEISDKISDKKDETKPEPIAVGKQPENSTSKEISENTPLETTSPKPNSSLDELDNAISPGNLMPELCKTTKLISWVQENNVNLTPPTPYPLAISESATNLDTSSSIVVEDLPSEITTTPSPSVDSSISGSSSSSSTLDSTSTRLANDPSKIVVNPIGSNGLACNAITNKLSDIAEVAESLDTVIRDIQENSQSVEVESNPSPRDKKMGTLRSTSSEDWHSRSTEDDSFVTASEGRTSSFMSCNKSSFEYSEGDDSTLAFDMPDVNSPFNMSFDESEQSFISAQQDANKTPNKSNDSADGPLDDIEAPSSLADIDDLHSESVTPTPAENIEYFVDSIPVESETELEVAGISDAPTLEVLTECAPMPISVTPEVSICSNLPNGRQVCDDASTSSANTQQSTNSPNKPNASWRRSKYYENITKQTIKGFL